ncbi:MAG: right-handed parallel beta-helix repeat-containing protein [Actinomycetota bacterium]|nr:right-handed parallel beta-helix repeat-containing protein [Actinomycetota bacterium]
MRRCRPLSLGVLAAMAVGLLSAPSALAVTPVNCTDLTALFGTGAGAATAGGVYQLPAGICKASVAATNTNAFTLEGASGATTTLEPLTTGSIISGNSGLHVTLSGMTFTGSSTAAAVSIGSASGAVTVSGNMFTADTAGGVDIVAETATPTVISNNAFSGNSAIEGAGVTLGGNGAFTVTGNTFTANKQASVSAVGGGGLAISSNGGTNPVQVTGNTFGGPAAGDGNTSVGPGGGAWIVLSQGQTLTVSGNTFENNSIAGSHTATHNREGGGLFLGLSGGSTSYHVVPEIYGFGTSTTTLQYSDVCAETGGPAIPSGDGDMCANPQLNPDSTESRASPTVDAGANALVPTGLTTDLAGNQRILASHEGCFALGPVVDMGAFEATFHYPVPPCPPLLPGAPTLTSVSESASKWLESNHLATITKASQKLPVGTTFSLDVSVAATVKFVFEQSVSGRKVGKKCVAKSKHNAKNHRCTLGVTPDNLSFAGHAGTNTARFYGRISSHKKLGPGTYTLVITATAAGATSKPATLKFTVAKPARK